MPRPKAYDPQQGYKYQLLYKAEGEKEWEHLDYAKDKTEKDYLLGEYNLAYRGSGGSFKVEPLPKKYWSEKANG